MSAAHVFDTVIPDGILCTCSSCFHFYLVVLFLIVFYNTELEISELCSVHSLAINTTIDSTRRPAFCE